MTLKPLQDYVLLKELKPEEVTESGIFIPEDVDKEKNQGIVVEVGDKSVKSVEKGDKVLFLSYGFNEVEIEKEKYLIGKEENVIGKLI